MFECLDPDELPPSLPLLLPVTVLDHTPPALLLLSGLPTDMHPGQARSETTI